MMSFVEIFSDIINIGDVDILKITVDLERSINILYLI